MSSDQQPVSLVVIKTYVQVAMQQASARFVECPSAENYRALESAMIVHQHFFYANDAVLLEHGRVMYSRPIGLWDRWLATLADALRARLAVVLEQQAATADTDARQAG